MTAAAAELARTEDWHVNYAVFRHEAATPMSGHDGRCCVRARAEGREAYAAQQAALAAAPDPEQHPTHHRGDPA